MRLNEIRIIFISSKRGTVPLGKQKENKIMKALAEIILIIVSALIALIGTWFVLGPIANSFGPVVAAFSWVVVAYISIVVFNAEIK